MMNQSAFIIAILDFSEFCINIYYFSGSRNKVVLPYIIL